MWTLRFISGKYQGGEFPLRPDREIIIGRSCDLDMVLVEDMVSRKHAKITTDEKGVSIQDLGSTNGTFVNGEKIRKVELKDGDRILIGTSIIKLVAVTGDGLEALSETEARSKMQVAASHRPSPKSMSGNIEEIPLPDLLQLLSTSRKSGVLVLRSDWGVGRIFLRKGQIYFATIDDGMAQVAREGDVPDAELDSGRLRARAAGRAPGARGDAGLDRGAAHGGHAPARRVPGDHRRAAGGQRPDLGRPSPGAEAARPAARRAGRVPARRLSDQRPGAHGPEPPHRSRYRARPRSRSFSAAIWSLG